MMARNILIGLGAGLAAALLFFGLISGTTLALPLFLLSPLPIAIAGLGFGTLSGATGAAFAGALIGTVLWPLSGLFHFITFGAPVAWAAHLIGLARPDPDAPEEREWYPLDRVVLRLAVAAPAAVIVVGAIVGFDPASWTGMVLDALEAMLRTTGGEAPSRADLEPIVRLSVALAPATVAAMLLGITVFNCWLGARIARMSGQMQRPWTPVWTVSLPKEAVIVLAVAAAAAFLPAPFGLAGTAVLGAGVFAFALTGFGLLHFLLAGRPAKLATLLATYLATFLFTLPIVIAAIAGIADTLLGLRARKRP